MVRWATSIGGRKEAARDWFKSWSKYQRARGLSIEERTKVSADLGVAWELLETHPPHLGTMRMERPVGWRDVPSSERLNFTTVTHFMLRWASFNYPTFHLTHSLAAALMLTDCSGIKWGEIAWPFESFAVTLPPEFIYYEGIEGQEIPVNHIIWHRYVSPLDGGPVSGRPAAYTCLQGDDGASVHRALLIPHPETGAEEVVQGQGPNPDRIAPGLNYAEIDETASAAALRLVMNLAIYVGDLAARGEWRPEAVKQNIFKRKKKQKARSSDWTLGKEIKLSAEVRKSATNRQPTDARWKLQKRCLVRGHWKNVPYGPGRGLRKRTQIQPYWRGPEAGKRTERLYEVE